MQLSVQFVIISVVSKCVLCKMKDMMMGGGSSSSSDSGMEVMVMGADGKMMR